MREILIGAAGAVVAVLIVAVAERSFDAMSTLLGPSIPSGAVVAFEADKCPDDWELYHAGAGRFLFGADNEHELRSEGGTKEHQLTVSEMPAHRHDDRREEGKADHLLVQVTGSLTETTTDTDGHPREFNNMHGVRMESRGQSQPHENMPPYRVVNFCVKR